MDETTPAPRGGATPPTFREGLAVWLRVALNSFGGPAGQIAVMHRILVEEKRWIDEARFLHALNYCMLLPGPEAQQLAIYIGWLLHRVRGGLAAGILFVLPGAAAMLLLSFLYVRTHDLLLVQALFFGLKPAVLAVVLEAVVRIGRRALRGVFPLLLAAAAFLALFAFQVPFPIVVVGAAIAGLVAHGAGVHGVDRLPGGVAGGNDVPTHAVDSVGHSPESTRGDLTWGRAITVALAGVGTWFLPVAVAALLLGPRHLLVEAGLFFSRTAALSFGGAYAALAWVAQEAVVRWRWLAPGEMLDGLGMAETTPGPLILVTQFVGFLAGWRSPAPFDPAVGAVLAAAMTSWVMFAPSFVWIFLGAPWVERLRGLHRLNAALSAVTAAVVGVILNLAAWFALHVLFGRLDPVAWGPVRLLRPDWGSLDPAAAGLAAVALLLVFPLRRGLGVTLAVTTGLGALLHLVGRP